MIIFVIYAISLFTKKSQANKFTINFTLILREIKKSIYKPNSCMCCV